MSTKTFFLPVSLAFALSGCGLLHSNWREAVEKDLRGLDPPVEDHAAVVSRARQLAEHPSTTQEEKPLPEGAGLEDYVRIALRDNPEIRRAVRKAEALGYRIPQATSLPDPMLDLMPPIGDMIETAAGMMSGSVGLRQKIPFPWKLRTRGKIAEREMRMALAELADARIATVARVQRAYYEYYLAHVSIEIAEESRVLLEQIRDVASARYRSGAATQQDVLRAEVELYELVNELITLRQKQETARALLNTLMDRKVDAPLPPPEPFELREVGWRLPQAMEVAVRNNPRLVGLREQIERDLEAVELARLGYFPDLTVGFTYTFISASGLSPAATGDDARSLGLGIDLPVWWQRIRAQILEARARTLSAAEAYEALRNEIFFQLQDTLVGVDAQYRQARLLRDLIVPRAWQAVEVATSSYRAGALEFTALIENWRKWLELSLAYHRALARLEQRFSDLQQLLGMRVARTEDERTRGGEQEEESREGEGILRNGTDDQSATRSATQHAAAGTEGKPAASAWWEPADHAQAAPRGDERTRREKNGRESPRKDGSAPPARPSGGGEQESARSETRGSNVPRGEKEHGDRAEKDARPRKDMEIARSDEDLRIPTERTEKRAPHDTKQGSDTTEGGR